MAFNFGGSTPAPASGSFGGFGSSPAPGGFGSAPSAFGAAPAPSTLFSFGNPAPAPSTGFSFSGASNPAPSPSTGFGFGSTGNPAPAPSTGFSFSNPVAAPSTGFGFGGTPSPAPGGAFSFSSSTPAPAPGAFSGFGAQQQQQQQQAPATTIAGNMHYSSLTPQMKQAFDHIHEAIMRHKRAMLNLQSMAPQLLLPANGNSSSTEQNGPKITVVKEKLNRLNIELNRLHTDVETLQSRVQKQKEADEAIVRQTYMYAKWPVEAVAARKGLRLANTSPTTVQEEKKEGNEAATTADVQTRVREALDRAMAEVDRIEKMPSPYLWQSIHEMERRLNRLGDQTVNLQKQLEQSARLENDFQLQQDPVNRIEQIVESQHQALWQLTSRIQDLREKMERVRYRYRHYERGENVLERAAQEEAARKRKLDEQIQMQFIKAVETPGESGTPGPAPAPSSNAAPAPTSAFSFSSSPAPASTNTGTTFSFNSSSAGSTTAPAPSTSFSFSNPGSTTTPAPATFGSFNSASTSQPNKKKTSRSGSRLRK